MSPVFGVAGKVTRYRLLERVVLERRDKTGAIQWNVRTTVRHVGA
jgi:hypothetical protein